MPPQPPRGVTQHQMHAHMLVGRGSKQGQKQLQYSISTGKQSICVPMQAWGGLYRVGGCSPLLRTHGSRHTAWGLLLLLCTQWEHTGKTKHTHSTTRTHTETQALQVTRQAGKQTHTQTTRTRDLHPRQPPRIPSESCAATEGLACQIITSAHRPRPWRPHCVFRPAAHMPQTSMQPVAAPVCADPREGTDVATQQRVGGSPLSRRQQPMRPQEQTGQQVRGTQHTRWGCTTTQHLRQHMRHTLCI